MYAPAAGRTTHETIDYGPTCRVVGGVGAGSPQMLQNLALGRFMCPHGQAFKVSVLCGVFGKPCIDGAGAVGGGGVLGFGIGVGFASVDGATCGLLSGPPDVAFVSFGAGVTADCLLAVAFFLLRGRTIVAKSATTSRATTMMIPTVNTIAGS